jgi:hypothetical protein
VEGEPRVKPGVWRLEMWALLTAIHMQCCQIAVYTAILLTSRGIFILKAAKSSWRYRYGAGIVLFKSSGKIAEFCLTDIWREIAC